LKDVAKAHVDEDTARGILLVQAFDSSPPDNPLWTPEDRSWATRLARESTAKGAGAAAFVSERARHALQRLLPRDPGAARQLQRRLWNGSWLLLAALLGGLIGLLVDNIGSSQRINLLAPPVWAVVVWNVIVYLGLLAALLLPSRWPRRMRDLVALRMQGRLKEHATGQGVMASFQAAWTQVSEPLMSSRAACVLHVAAATLALGMIGSLYVRGLVLDYRASWQSTFLDAPQVHAALSFLLAPVSSLTGVALPDVNALQALRTAPDVAPPTASAAPWIHLYAALLMVVVVLPRSVLALWSVWRARALSQRLPLPLHEPYFARLQRDWQGGAAHVQVLPHGATPTAAAVAGLRQVLAKALGEPLGLSLAGAVAYGDEERARPPAPEVSLRVLLIDLASTPEADTQGRFIQAQRQASPTMPMLLITDESAMRSRFANMPARLAERRTAWQGFCAAQGLGWVSVDLLQPDVVAADDALQRALHVT
jgi:Protein of unknown function (DUF2868)